MLNPPPITGSSNELFTTAMGVADAGDATNAATVARVATDAVIPMLVNPRFFKVTLPSEHLTREHQSGWPPEAQRSLNRIYGN